MANNRMSRVNSEIQKSLMTIISRFDDSEIASAMISIMKVDTFSDFSMSKIYVSVFGSEEQKNKIVLKLNQNKKSIRYELAHSLKLRNVPELMFIVDDVEERAERVLKLFDQIEADLKETTTDGQDDNA
ncbi:MAG: 30S ribosome-binding factor RbfA [Clostridia bacterium]|nr:30S ribosome-binding factor RbfA [Clostridia bacterium]